MDPRTQERVERWDSRPYTGGYDGLSDLASDDFTGAVTAAGTWLFSLNGRIIGVVDGSIEDFADAAGERYDAPDPALPLLCSMLESGGEPHGKYYTNDTPLEEVDETLTSGSFTGYVELSDGVLSGDYYLVYYGGRRMAVAYIGNAERLFTGEEAFSRAADEVGIYEVVDVNVEVTDIPGAEPTAPETDAEEPGTASAEDATTDVESSAADAIAEAEPSLEDDPLEAGADDGRSEAAADGPAVDAPDGVDAVEPAESETTADGPPADDASGITTDEVDPGDQPSPGITDASDGEPTAAPPGGDRSSDVEADDGRVPSSEQSTAATGGDAAASDRNRTGPVRYSRTDRSGSQPSEPADDADDRSPPDPQDLEVAAEELTENGVPWMDADDGEVDDEASTTDSLAGDTDVAVDSGVESDSDLEERFEQEARWRETRSIPSIDPENSSKPAGRRSTVTGSPSSGQDDSAGASTGWSNPDGTATSTSVAASDAASSTAESDSGRSPEPETGTGASSRDSVADTSSRSGPESTAENALESDMLEREDKIDRLTQRIDELEAERAQWHGGHDELEAERDRLRAENEELTETIDELRSKVAALEDELDQLRTLDATGATAETTSSSGADIPPARALRETNLFIRYGSKSQPTLESAHAGEADAVAVGANLRLEHHTGFDGSETTVDGQPYEEFLRESMPYRFVDWLVGTLLYEIRDTGHENVLDDLYDVIPRIDRAELGGEISLAEDDTADVPDSVTFDVVAFDKRGNPLVVANINDSREPASEELLVELEEQASAVTANYPDLGAAIAVTSSFFDPGALDVVEQATSSGFLSRGSKVSYVNLSRKQGYHLCLVESRDGEFHVTVPEL